MTILAVTTAEADARLVSTEGISNEAGFKLTRCWPWVAGKTATGSYVVSLVAALNAITTYTNPQANGRVYVGTFINSKTYAQDESTDGDNSRSTSIYQVLTLVKTPSTVASLGNPDVLADKSTLNFKGWKEGTQTRIYHKYKNINPYMNHSSVLALAPTDTGYTIVKREIDIEEDKSATLKVTFENDTWAAKTWASDKVKIQWVNNDTKRSSENGNKGGAGIERTYELTGIPITQRATIIPVARKADTHFVAQNVTIVERDNGEYVVRQQAARTFASTTDTAAHIELIQSNFGGAKEKALRRVWPRRTYAAKETLIGTGGKAVSNYLYSGTDTYIHDSVTVRDNRDGSYDVMQDLGNFIGGGGVYDSPFFNDSNIEWKRYTRSKDNKQKRVKYIRRIKSTSSEPSARNWIRTGITNIGATATNYKVVEGSARVTKKGRYFYVAEVLLTKHTKDYNLDWQ